MRGGRDKCFWLRLRSSTQRAPRGCGCRYNGCGRQRHHPRT
nr:MAG TPA: hypothetical protein [Caudoviricetes sp.]